MTTTERVTAAASEIVGMLQLAYGSNNGIHAESVIGAAAAITGEWVLWALEVDVPQEGWIVGDRINQIMFEGANAVARIVEAAVEGAKGSVDKLPTGEMLAANAAAAMGTPGYPPMTIPACHLPREWSPLAAPRFRQSIAEIARQQVLSSHETLVACAISVGILIDATKGVLDPTVAGTLALEIMVGVSHMSPHATKRLLAAEMA
jgi:hypothetical protein